MERGERRKLLVRIAYYFEGIKVAKGNITPFGLNDLDVIYKWIRELQYDDKE